MIASCTKCQWRGVPTYRKSGARIAASNACPACHQPSLVKEEK